MKETFGTVFHGSPKQFEGKNAVPQRQVRTTQSESFEEVIIFDEESFHATPYRWVALAYTNKPAPINRDGIQGQYGMGVN